MNCPAGQSDTLKHNPSKGLAWAQCPIFSLSIQFYLVSDSLFQAVQVLCNEPQGNYDFMILYHDVKGLTK